MGNDLGVGLRQKFVSLSGQFFLQFQIVLNDAVVYNNDRMIMVKVRMRVQIGRNTVGCPSGVADADGSRKGCAVLCQLLKYFQASYRFFHLDFFSVIDSNSGRVVSAVFQLCQSVQQYRGSLVSSNISNNSTHRFCPPNSKRRHPCSIFKLCRLFASCSLHFYHAAPFLVNLMEHFVFTYKNFPILFFTFIYFCLCFFLLFP